MIFSKMFERKTKVTYGKMDMPFLMVVLVLVTVGLIMMFSASYANAYYLKNNSTFYISRQLVAAAIGVLAMTIASKMDYRIFRIFAFPMYILTIILLIVALFMPALNGAKRWIFIGPINFQPSEIAKFTVVILFATLICRYFQRMQNFLIGFVLFVVLLAPILGLMIAEPHLSGTIIIVLLGAVMMFIGGTHIALFGFGFVAVIGAVTLVMSNPDLMDLFTAYAGTRIEVWQDPTTDPQGKGFQTLQSLYAIASGGIMGTGIGNSRQKYLYLPEPYNDFIFAVICEEMGFVGAVLIICLFILLIWRGFVIATRCPDKFGSLVAAGLTSQVALQTILNIAVVTNTVPNTGISLPFFSYGGTSLAMLMGEMGIILSISRVVSIEKT